LKLRINFDETYKKLWSKLWSIYLEFNFILGKFRGMRWNYLLLIYSFDEFVVNNYTFTPFLKYGVFMEYLMLFTLTYGVNVWSIILSLLVSSNYTS